jgi:hypothetical protein
MVGFYFLISGMLLHSKASSTKFISRLNTPVKLQFLVRAKRGEEDVSMFSACTIGLLY